ncbi:hypothetical protein BGW36DRAFT_387696 [Talaromyces proteolyticus]|uniref:ER membrane protein complex subunit 7 beta-sandwich domain-containing protein n=1 Tax=Talaromyces proteolyticus TaxID=1131652 RepID=A0AAD4KIF2_9EURO|nr:uncharacterized protein BGW36DRAFT_387696 [Talaromyces proteolyticus]KAH8691113.1 hypothetical protein BGW36DRAFT_387696 [Talaromyces proteolyticus]
MRQPPLSFNFLQNRQLPHSKHLTMTALLHLLTLLSAGSCIYSTAAAASLIVQIPPSNVLPNPHSLSPNTHATLTTLSSSQTEQQQQILTAPLTRSAEFVFADLPPSSSKESYLLDIRSRDYIFAPYRVDVSSDGAITGIWETFRGNQWENRGAEKYVAQQAGAAKGGDDNVTVDARVLGRRQFYEERPKCEFYQEK